MSCSKSSTMQFIAMIILLDILGSSYSMQKLNTLPISKSRMANVEDPVIGILTQPLSPLFMKKFPNKDYKGYVASSYVKWVELTGARAVVIPHFVDIKQIAELLT